VDLAGPEHRAAGVERTLPAGPRQPSAGERAGVERVLPAARSCGTEVTSAGVERGSHLAGP
jgi:hypothetical protein